MKRRLLFALATPAILLAGCDSLSRFTRVQPAVAENAPPHETLAASPTSEDAPTADNRDRGIPSPGALNTAAAIPIEAGTGTNTGTNTGSGVTASLSDLDHSSHAAQSASPAPAPSPPAQAEASSTELASESPTAEPPGSGLQLASAPRISTAARRTLDAVVASLPNPAADRRERLAREIAAFQPFPFAFDLPTVAGDSLHSRRLDSQLVVVDIWATWCGPCRKAIPEFVAIQDLYASRGVQVVGITCDTDDPAKAEEVRRNAAEIGERLKVNYPLLIDDGSTTAQVPGFRGYPTTLFLAPDGRVLYKVTGMQSEAQLAAILDHLLN